MKKSKFLTLVSLLSTLVCLFTAMPVMAEDAFIDALKNGTTKLDMRLRLETVEQDNALADATATTLRTRLGYMTGDYKGASAYLEFENVTAIDDDYEANPNNAAKTKSVVADPEGTEVNQVFLSYKAIAETEMKLGRQRLILDNARFVGNVGWRQNEQTFDALTVVNKSVSDLSLTYGYVDQVNTIGFSDFDVAAHFLNASLAGIGGGALTGYGYLIDNEASPGASAKTFGARFAGKTELATAKLLYTLEVAKQSSYQDGNKDIEADYLLAELGGEMNGLTVKLGYEVLGADDNEGFETPLATKHAFNGWTDQFLNTPMDGLQDMYVSVDGSVAGVKLMAIYHTFSDDDGSNDYGTEVDLLAVKKINDTFKVLAKYASYSAEDASFFKNASSTQALVDTDKFWLMGELSF